jgi:hypothetical protein
MVFELKMPSAKTEKDGEGGGGSLRRIRSLNPFFCVLAWAANLQVLIREYTV